MVRSHPHSRDADGLVMSGGKKYHKIALQCYSTNILAPWHHNAAMLQCWGNTDRL